jgi:hypothetical protein
MWVTCNFNKYFRKPVNNFDLMISIDQSIDQYDRAHPYERECLRNKKFIYFQKEIKIFSTKRDVYGSRLI